MSKWSENLVAETRKRLGYGVPVKPHPIETSIADAARKATILEAANVLKKEACLGSLSDCGKYENIEGKIRNLLKGD